MVAFETWDQTGLSSIYFGEDAKNFIDAHNASNTFATLHVFEDDEKGLLAYESEQEWRNQ